MSPRPRAEPSALVESSDRAATLAGLDALGDLRPNWNGYVVESMGPDLIEAARQFVTSLPHELPPCTQAVPMTRGRVQIEWHRGTRSLEIEFDEPGRIHYLKWDPNSAVEDEGLRSLTDSETTIDLIRWFAEGANAG